MQGAHPCISAAGASLEEREEDDLEWTAVSESALLVCVEELDENTRDRWSAHAPQIEAVASKTAGLTYLGNVCSCGAFQGDWYLTKPGAPFFPLDDAGVSAIDVHWIDEPIVARAGVSLSAWPDWLIAKSPYGAGTRPKQGFSSRG